MSIEAMKQALEALEFGGWDTTTKAILAIKECLENHIEDNPAMAKHLEPVAWSDKVGGIGFDTAMPNANYKVTATVVPAQNQEPIAWLCQKENGHFDVLTDQTCKKCFPVYTHPKREPLTDDEMLMIYGQKHEGKKYSLGRMVEAAHGIKE